ncbi:hypothetical protein BH23ACT9_BH23ACT9_29560 [soil metagenome]
MTSLSYDPLRALECLHRHGVDFVLIGGVAAVAHGSPLATFDTDITPQRSLDNLDRLAAALRELNARIRTSAEPVAFPIDGGFLAAQPHMLNLTTDAGDLDLTFAPAGFPEGFAQLRPGAVEVSLVEGAVTAVAALRDVIASKAAADRDKDRAALPYLRALLARIDGG